jgi:uncharacterized integral membrane protein
VADDDLSLDELGGEEPEPKAKPSPKKKKDGEPGLFSRLGGKVTAPFAGFRPNELLNAKTIGLAIVAALALWLLLANLAPVRIVLFFWTVDVPKAFDFLLAVALGALLMWLWGRARVAKKPAEGEGGK